MDQRPRNGHALQLAAAELLRQALAQTFQAHGFEHVLHALLPIRIHAAQQHQRQGDVLRHIQMRQHMEGLKHKAQMCSAPDGTLGFVECGKVCALMQHTTFLPTVQTGQAVEKRGFSYARVANDGDKFACLYFAAHLLEYRSLLQAFAIAFGQIVYLQQCRCVGRIGDGHEAILTRAACP